MSSYTDFSDAQPNTFDVIPDNTEVPVIFAVQAGDPDLGDGCLKRSKNTDAIMLNLEATITAGKFAKRKFFPSFYMGVTGGQPTEKQQTGIDMARAKLRAIVEAARGFSPTDETPAAVAARKLASLREIDGMECSVVLGVEKGEGTFPDKNVIKRVVPHGKAAANGGHNQAAEAQSMRAAAPSYAAAKSGGAAASKKW